MPDLSPLEAYEVLHFSEGLLSRLRAAEEATASKRSMKREKDWLAAAIELVTMEREPVAALLDRARILPDLADVAHESASEKQEGWVDALEKLLAGITFHAGSRAPIIEALFPHAKLPSLRRAKKDVALQYAADLERRIKSGYVTRMLAQDEFAFAKPVLEQIVAAQTAWQTSWSPTEIDEAALPALREELVKLGTRMELVIRQAKLLAEAALMPVPKAFDEAGLQAKPRKRSAKPIPAPETPPAVEEPAPEAPAAKSVGKKGKAKKSAREARTEA